MKKPGMLILAVVISLFHTAGVYAQEELYEKAVQAYLKKDFKTSVKCLKEYVAQKPDAKAYYLLGYSTYMIKRKGVSLKARSFKDNAADEYFRQAYLIDPNFTPRAIEFNKYRR